VNAVFFDMDGVLLESFEAWLSVMNDTARHFGHPPIEATAFRAVFGQSTDADVARFFPGESVDAIEAYYAARFHEHAGSARPLPFARFALEGLDERGILTAVITNTSAAIARPLLESLELSPHALVGGTDVPRGKPAPDMIFRGCEVLSVEPWDVLVVGDSEYDRQAASAAGCFFAGFGGISGNFTISSLEEVLAIVDGDYS
jgi:HAD superfamily hydrolase (TIGR01509 family)